MISRRERHDTSASSISPSNRGGCGDRDDARRRSDICTTSASSTRQGSAPLAQVASDYHYAAEMFVNAGANFVVPDFNNVIETGGDLFVMADQVRRSVVWAYKNAASFGGDADRFYISGHSSGGQWVGVLLTTDWQKDFGLPPIFIKGAVAASGMFDLKPVRLSAR